MDEESPVDTGMLALGVHNKMRAFASDNFWWVGTQDNGRSRAT